MKGKVKPDITESQRLVSIPCICVYNFYCVYLWGPKVSIVSLLSIISMPVAPRLHQT
jgi:hypothetical protein